MSLPQQWREWATFLMRYGVRFTDIGHTGRSERQKYNAGDEDDRASERESLASAPAFRERRHRGLSRRLVTVCGSLDPGGRVTTRPHPGATLRRDCIEEEDAADDDAFSSKWRRFNAEMLARVGRRPCQG
jgi:hypothetical protein